MSTRACFDPDQTGRVVLSNIPHIISRNQKNICWEVELDKENYDFCIQLIYRRSPSVHCFTFLEFLDRYVLYVGEIEREDSEILA